MAADMDTETSRSRRRWRSPQPKPVAEKRNQSANASPSRSFSAMFPLSRKDGWSQWCSNTSPAALEERVFSFIPYIQRPEPSTNSSKTSASSSKSSLNTSAASTKDSSHLLSPNSASDPYGPRKWSSQLVTLSGKNRALNEFCISRVGENPAHNLVMLHGYGAGLGFFYKNFEPLSRRPGWRLFALDMLGMGNSSRPPFKIRAKDRAAKITEAENWFIDALEEWRVQRGIDRMTLLGHSMGGYMVSAYALKYPGHIDKLILVSPVGIPEDPWATKAEIPDQPSGEAAAGEILRDEGIAQLDDGAVDIKPPKDAQKPDDPNKPFSKPPSKFVSHLWDANISPFSIIRLTGPLGPRLTSGWTSRRFAHLPTEEAAALHDYSYSLFRQRGSGEYALAYILAPGAFAREPLIRRIHKIGRQQGEKGVPIVFMYGDEDWMDVNGGYAAEKKIKEENEKVWAEMTEEERKGDNGDATVLVIQKAGHHLYLDNFEQFNQVMEVELEDVERRTS
ncbi:Alpha/Beta hydrolase protein [Macrophomina phaseolina]|uniref:Alpha/Beta hydrolase protein n=1 Tax=Macrophomina phaseolina TaxID=35725 RepID=A0ABQ8G1U9_9PEZI|nr:Alpha/Beta hydrolase protein [Macrophomina phaseolina]